MNEITYVVKVLVIRTDELENFFGMNWIFFSIETFPQKKLV
jgi:hypothetical protein